jgi:hypothetical protein
VLEDLFDHPFIFYETDNSHPPLALWAGEGISLEYFFTDPFTKFHHPLLMTGRAEMATFA